MKELKILIIHDFYATYQYIIYRFCMGVQRHCLVFITHIFLTGKECQILPAQYLAMFSQGNMRNTPDKHPVHGNVCSQGGAHNTHQI